MTSKRVLTNSNSENAQVMAPAQVWIRLMQNDHLFSVFTYYLFMYLLGRKSFVFITFPLRNPTFKLFWHELVRKSDLYPNKQSGLLQSIMVVFLFAEEDAEGAGHA